jgi:hypothetical protein
MLWREKFHPLIPHPFKSFLYWTRGFVYRFGSSTVIYQSEYLFLWFAFFSLKGAEENPIERFLCFEEWIYVG